MMLIFSIPFAQIFSTGLDTLFLQVYSLSFPSTIMGVQVILLTNTTAIVLLYLFLLISTGIHSQKENNVAINKPRIIVQVLSTLLIINQTCFNLPNKCFPLIVIIQKFISGNQTSFLFVSAFVVLILDIMITLFFQSFLSCIYPLRNVHWALPYSREFIVNEIINFLLAIALSIPSKTKILAYIFGAATFLQAITHSMIVTYYHESQIYLQTLYQSIQFSMLITMTGIYSVAQTNDYNQISIFVLLTFSLFILKIVFIKTRVQTILASNLNIKSNASKYKWVWGLTMTFLYAKSEMNALLKKKYLEALSLLISHYRKCSEKDCACQESQSIKRMVIMDLQDNDQYREELYEILLILYQIGLQPTDLKNNESPVTTKNSNIELIGTFFSLEYKGNCISALYHASKTHDCQKCNFSECFQFSILKRLILDKHYQLQSANHKTELSEFQQFITFESRFKKYLKTVSTMACVAEEYWLGIQKKDMDLSAALGLGSKLLGLFQEFEKQKDLILNKCGENQKVSIIAFKVYASLLNFEQEADLQMETIKAFQQKMRLNQEELEEKTYILVVSGDPSTFQQILLVSKTLSSLIGYDQESLVKSKVTVLMPTIIGNAHSRFLHRFISRKHSHNKTIIFNSVWLKLKNGTIKNISLRVFPEISSNFKIQFLGLITEQEQIHVDDEIYQSDTVFCILTDLNDRVLHYSSNFLAEFQLSDQALARETSLHLLIPDIPENQEEIQDSTNNIFKLIIQTLQAESENFVERTFPFSSSYSIKLEIQTLMYGDDLKLKQYLFVIIDDKISFPSQNVSRKSAKIFSSQNHERVMIESENKQTENNQDLQSYSAEGHHSNLEQKYCEEVSEVKSKIDFSSTPQVLKKLKCTLLIGFLIHVCLSTTYLAINMSLKDSLQTDLILLNGEKNMKGALAYETLILTLVIFFENLPDWFNKSDLFEYVPDYGVMFQGLNQQVATILGDAIGNYSTQQHYWDEQIKQQTLNETIQIVSISDLGQVMVQNMTFKDAFGLLLSNSMIVSSFQASQFALPWDIFQYNTISSYAQAVAQLDNPLKSIVQNTFFVIYNGGKSILDQLFQIDSTYVSSLINQGQVKLNELLIYTIICISLTLVISIACLPLFMRIHSSFKVMMEITQRIQKSTIMEMIKNIRLFNSFCEEDAYKRSDQLLEKLLSSKNYKLTQEINVQRRDILNESSKQDTSIVALTRNSQQQTTQNTMLETTKANSLKQTKQGKLLIDQDEQKLSRGLSKIKKPQPKPEPSRNEEKKLQEIEEEQVNEEDIEVQFQEPTDATNKNQEDIKKMKFQTQIKKRNTLAVFLTIITSILLSLYFGVTYLLQWKYMSQFEQGFQDIDIFFQTTPCTYFSFFLFYSSIMFNQSIGLDSPTGQRMDNFNNICLQNEIKYRDMNQNSDGVFKDFYNVLDILDSSEYCNYTLSTNMSTLPTCAEALGGIFKLGQTAAIKVTSTQLQSAVLRYQSMPPSNRTAEWLQQQFFNIDLINYVIVQILQVGFVLYAEQPKIISEFQGQINLKYSHILSVYFVYLVFIAVIFAVTQIFLIKVMKNVFFVLRLLLKTIPADEIMLQKSTLKLIDTKAF